MNQILVVDQNIANLRYIKAQLADNYDWRFAKNGLQAVAMAEKLNPDLVILGIDLPDLDGFQTMSRMRQMPGMAGVPFIFLSANHDPDMEIKALIHGAVDFIAKPVECRLLRHRLDLHLRLNAYQSSLEKTIRELEDVIVSSFSELVECRDANSGGHVQRTKRYASILGQALIDDHLFTGQLNASTLDLLSRAAPLHDIGKIGISDLLLMKKGSLSMEEYETVKLHTVIGAEVLSSIYGSSPKQDYLKYAIIIAEGHHERYDGRGYPGGKAGDAIDVFNRVMSVVNVYDALVTDRSYRPAHSHEDARNIVLAGRGTEFDPVIIDAFSKVCRLFEANS
ncbi:MAG: response regulator [Deltaproteobacteria bacterium]|jgi:putative two-component system response regulator|nr:response regulator [Deltaproteobacteria bacterium]